MCHFTTVFLLRCYGMKNRTNSAFHVLLLSARGIEWATISLRSALALSTCETSNLVVKVNWVSTGTTTWYQVHQDLDSFQQSLHTVETTVWKKQHLLKMKIQYLIQRWKLKCQRKMLRFPILSLHLASDGNALCWGILSLHHGWFGFGSGHWDIAWISTCWEQRGHSDGMYPPLPTIAHHSFRSTNMTMYNYHSTVRWAQLGLQQQNC